MTDEEQYWHERLRMLQEAYAREAKPIIDRLVRIKSMQVPTYLISADQMQLVGDWLTPVPIGPCEPR